LHKLDAQVSVLPA